MYECKFLGTWREILGKYHQYINSCTKNTRLLCNILNVKKLKYVIYFILIYIIYKNKKGRLQTFGLKTGNVQITLDQSSK